MLSKIVLPKDERHGALEGSPSISMNKIRQTDQIIVILNPRFLFDLYNAQFVILRQSGFTILYESFGRLPRNRFYRK